MGDMGAGWGMLVVETIAKIRRAYFAHKKPIKTICRELRLSRKVVRKVIRSQATEFRYERGRQPLAKDARRLGAAHTRTAVVSLAKEHLVVTVDQWNADPWLLGTPAGVW